MDHIAVEIVKLFASFGMPGLALFVLWYWVSKGVFKDAHALGYAVAGVLALALGSIIYSRIHQPDDGWPDRRTPAHLDNFVDAHVVNVMAGDTLKLRSGPGTASNIIAEIPADGGGVVAFDLDMVRDGDTWWCPVKWQGHRGYVGRRYLAGF
jgi:hypothetical protein